MASFFTDISGSWEEWWTYDGISGKPSETLKTNQISKEYFIYTKLYYGIVSRLAQFLAANFQKTFRI